MIQKFKNCRVQFRCLCYNRGMQTAAAGKSAAAVCVEINIDEDIMGIKEYEQALKLGMKAYRGALAKGEYPYLPALDDILSCIEVQSEEILELVEIPMDQIVGTKTSGRQNAFAVNFMPLMPENSEFAGKWARLYDYQTEEGNTDPIVVYEFINKFYVQEGNKRVSVYKYLDAPSMEARVIRIIPKKNESLENKLYYEFLDFYKCTEINYLWFTKQGSFEALTKAVGKEPDEVWTEDERRDFSSVYNTFYKIFKEKGGKYLEVTAGDAFLFYLSLYPYEKVLELSEGELRKDIDRIWNELPVLNRAPEAALVLDPVEPPEVGMIDKLFSISAKKADEVAFIHDRNPEDSSWAYSHELGRTHLEEVFAGKVQTKSYVLEDSGMDIYELIEKAIQDGNEIIFTTHQKFLSASLKKALEHPEVKILNCSLNHSFKAIRTYYGRMYEAKFLCGMVAGAMTPNNKIAYCADYPIYGAFANINAFALGAKMVNPRAKVYIHWLCDTTSDLDRMVKENDISLVSYTDMIRLSSKDRKFGLYLTEGEETIKLATPVWNWGKFYEKMVRDIQAGSWTKGAEVKSIQAVNYWWGISSDIIDLILSQKLPRGISTLVDVMREEIHTERFHAFQDEITLQDGTVVGEMGSWLSPEQVITMDWYVENVVGKLPQPENLTEEAKELMALQNGLLPATTENVTED